jgi:hypothetical protein
VHNNIEVVGVVSWDAFLYLSGRGLLYSLFNALLLIDLLELLLFGRCLFFLDPQVLFGMSFLKFVVVSLAQTRVRLFILA